MSKIALLLSCLLLSACQQEFEVDDKVNTVDEITECIGNEQMCKDLVDGVVNVLPLEVQDKIVDTSKNLTIYVGYKEDFLSYMSKQGLDYKSQGFSGITLYTYQEPTKIYSMADEYVIYHELGHAYDFTYWHKGEELLSHSPEWVDAWETEFISQYGQTSTQEFYAETFAMYFRTPKLLQKFCPKAYELHEKEFKNMK